MQQACQLDQTDSNSNSNINKKIINNNNTYDGEEPLPWNDASVLDTGLDHGGLSELRNDEDDEDGNSDISSDQGGDTSNCDHTQMHASLANRETRAVTKWKLVVLVVLLLSAIGTAWSVYCYIHNSETAQFHQSFDNSAQKVLESIGIGFEKTLKSLDSLAVAVVSHAITTNQTWPFVTVPHFAFHSAKMISNSDAVVVIMLPLVAAEKRTQWENYTITHNQWVNESVPLQEDYAFYSGPLNYDTSEYDGVIYGDFGPVEYDVE